MNNSICDDNKDWIFNVEEQYVRKVDIGQFGICEIPKNFENDINNCKKNIFLFTKYKEWLWLKRRKTYQIEVQNMRKDVWICKIISFNKKNIFRIFFI